jgi:hypothetical protein
VFPEDLVGSYSHWVPLGALSALPVVKPIYLSAQNEQKIPQVLLIRAPISVND